MFHIRIKTIVIFVACLFSVVSLVLMSQPQRYVAAPGIVSLFMVMWLWLRLWDCDGEIPFFDVGVLCAFATLIYTIYPLMNYWVDGMQFGFFGDNRLRQHNITPLELGIFHIRHVVYLSSFITCYAIFRGRGVLLLGNVQLPSRNTQLLILCIFLLLSGYFLVLQLTTGVNFHASYSADAFGSNVSAMASLPLPLLQLSSKLLGIHFVAKLGLLLIVVDHCRQRKWLVILSSWMMAEIVQTVLLKGSRTSVMIMLIAAALLYHRLIRRLSMKFLFFTGSLLFLFFIFLGLYRSYVDFKLLQAGLAQADGGLFSSNNEFQALLGTAYDILQFKELGVEFPWYLRLNDFISLFPPQQFLPFEKLSAADWYVRQIGREGSGVGYMWGVISQAIVGLDWLELALRGAILGCVLARVHRFYLKHQKGFLATMFYLFLCLKIYFTFRDTTFSVLANIVWEFVPFCIILFLWRFITLPLQGLTHEKA